MSENWGKAVKVDIKGSGIILIHVAEEAWWMLSFTGTCRILQQVSGNITHNDGGGYAWSTW
jgi:hypothetical protein